MSQSAATLDLVLHPKQGVAFNTEATETFFGGAAGGGKSHLIRSAAITWCTEIAGLQVYLFRRIGGDLVKNHMEGPNGFRALLAGWVACGFVTIVEDEIRFWNGSKIYLCHCKDEKDRFKYQGAEIHVLLIDELTHFTDKIYRYLRGRVRMVGIEVPEKYKGRFPRILCSGNPGGIGHQFVKSTFIDGAAAYKVYRAPKTEGGMLRQYIPAKLEDNPAMNDNDPEYEDRLHGLGSESLVRAMRHGDWDIVEGAYFDNFRRERHVIRPITIPDHWIRFRAGDWGSAKPFAFGWFAVASEDTIGGPGLVIPRGALVMYREWYGVKTDAQGKFIPDTGQKLHAEAVGAGVRLRDYGDAIAYGVLDPAAFSQDGGPSIAERMAKGENGEGVTFTRADNKRTPGRGAMGGWDQLRSRLTGDEDGHALLFFFSTCVHTIRTLPSLQHDQTNLEDLDTSQEDHAADMVRYACMSRPWIKKLVEQASPPKPGMVRLPGPPEPATGGRIRI
ncbi:terminase [Aminobacter sp. SR38]|jgi:hypothetical protein|uniref:terminase family protein n=1 Tax=Aminobacter sp. SR38 TaxID=2774562 RepID=UPI0017847C9C|nr:terminase family protein [Aminobacter sp. SR38]QOF71867.1 terminase [Aminobacter sp. SR38]